MRYIQMIWIFVFFSVSSSAFSEEDLVEKAWSCKPSLMPFYNDPWKSSRVSLNIRPSSILRFSEECRLSEEDKDILGNALLNTYALLAPEKGLLNSVGQWELANFDREKRKRESAVVEAAKAEALKAKDEERQARMQQLRSGAVKAESMRDIWLANNDQINSLQEIMASTLLRADNAVYGGRVTIDGEEREGVWRVKFDSDSLGDIVFQTPSQADAEATESELARAALRGRALSQALSQNGTRHYAQLNLNKKSILFARNLRIGSVVWVVGRYKANRKYKLTNRTERTMPVLDVLYIGE